jgi:lysine 2,3-aminomutase
MLSVLPPTISIGSSTNCLPQAVSQKEFLEDVENGMQKAPMSIRLTPHILSLINWSEPFTDPLIRQFVPLGSRLLPDHPELRLDSLDETTDSPVKGLIHRYPDKAVFLGMFKGYFAIKYSN